MFESACSTFFTPDGDGAAGVVEGNWEVTSDKSVWLKIWVEGWYLMIKHKSIKHCNWFLKVLRWWCKTTEKEPSSGDFSEEKEKSIALKQAEQLDDYSTSCTVCTASRTAWSEFDEDAWICADVEETCCSWVCGPRWAWEPHFNLFNIQCENACSDSCFTDMAEMCFV